MNSNLGKHSAWLRLRLVSGVCLALVCFASLVLLSAPSDGRRVVLLPSGVTGAEVQAALDSLTPAGGEVVLPEGVYDVCEPIVLGRDHLALSGAGEKTVLRLADGANCPVVIMGEPVNHPRRIVKDLRVSRLFIDGNRAGQQREIWRLQGEGNEIRNNDITVQAVSDSTVEDVVCIRARSGGLVTTLGVRRLTVRNFSSSENEFDGLACYATEDCLFAELNLHDNPGAGISLDLAFRNNTVSNAVLTANDLGIFMRESCSNRFENVNIQNSRNYGVFMAQAGVATPNGWEALPGTACSDNTFANLQASNCRGAAFRVNDDTCINNVVIGPQFQDNPAGNFSLAQPDLIAVE